MSTDPAGAPLASPALAIGHSLAPPWPIGLLRITLGAVFFWAFIDKLFGLGAPTDSGSAVVTGTSPTTGYLMSRDGTFSDLFHSMAGHWWIDVLYMLSLVGAGVALLLGIASRLGTVAVVGLMGMLWLGSLPLDNHPFIDQHLFYAVAAIALLVVGADRTWGLGSRWHSLTLVQRFSILR